VGSQLYHDSANPARVKAFGAFGLSAGGPLKSDFGLRGAVHGVNLGKPSGRKGRFRRVPSGICRITTSQMYPLLIVAKSPLTLVDARYEKISFTFSLVC
jgi:hypothetical protein